MQLLNTLLNNTDPERTLLIKGSSMFPYLRTGDILITEPTSPDKLKIGNIIVFDINRKKDFIVHRLLKISKDKAQIQLQTKGDNNISYDRTISDKEYVGRGIYLIRGYKTVNLDSASQGFLSKIYALLSFFNFNHHSIACSRPVNWLKNNKTISRIMVFPHRDIDSSVFKIQGSNLRLFKAFHGKSIIANAFIDETEERLLVKNWTMKYPYYNTASLSDFFLKIIDMAKNTGKTALIIENYDRGIPIIDNIRSLNLPEDRITLDGNNLIINIKEIS